MKYIFLLLCLVQCSFFSKAHWQQNVATTLVVSLDDKAHFLRGIEKFQYANNSPDTLKFLFVHLWPNAYKNDRTQFSEQQVENGKKDFYFSSQKDKGFIDSLQFTVDGLSAEYSLYENNEDVIRLDLPNPLAPGQSILVETPFRVKIPKVFSRLGHNGQSYFISQWFPKPAVYDHKGWHPMPYLDQGEFYSEFGSYDVSISLPKNYRLMATGNCETLSEQNWMDSLASLALPADTLFKRAMPLSSAQFKTIRFTENNVHDFAWFADKRWILRRDSISAEGNLGTTQIYTAFLPTHQSAWLDAPDMIKATVNSYGTSVGKYPYKTIKVVEGDLIAGGGMEYPTVTIIDKAAFRTLSSVVIHEVGHNWFYGMLGTNEREHPWMDEGMNSFYEQETHRIYRNPDSRAQGGLEEDFIYFQQVVTNNDQKISLPSTDYSSLNYGAVVYYKTALMLGWLEAYMGKEAFLVGMKSYFNEWQFKHPYPEDFKSIMQSHTDKDISWFFDAALRTTRPVDFALKSMNQKGDSLYISIKNNSDFAAPIQLGFYQKDSLLSTRWLAPFQNKKLIAIEAKPRIDKVFISSDFADSRMFNNELMNRRFFKKGGPELGAAFGMNQQSVKKIFLAPAFGYNVYDGFGLGLLCHNLSFPQNRFQFALVPQYGVSSKQLNGLAAVSYSWFPKHFFKEIRVQGNFKSYSQNKSDLNIAEPIFARYIKTSPFAEFVFKEKNARSTIRKRIIAKHYFIQEEGFAYVQDISLDSLYRPQITTEQNLYALLRYEYTNDRSFHPYAFNFECQAGQNFVKLGLETKLRIDYDVQNKSFYMRAYAGKFIATNTAPLSSRYYLNTTFSGTNDYLFDGTYAGRNEQQGLWSQQISMQEGGFKIPTNMYTNPLGRSDNWILAFNLKTDLPFGKLPIRLYADLATFADAKRVNPLGNSLSFNAGLELSLFKEVLNVYLPLLLSKDYGNYLKEMYPENRILKSLSFSINLQHFNGLRAHEKLFKELTQ